MAHPNKPLVRRGSTGGNALLTCTKTCRTLDKRGWILLHAGQQTDRPALREPLAARTIRGRELPTGAVLGIARLTGCHQHPAGSPPCAEFSQPGAWHLELSDVQALALPIPARGQLGPWRPTEDLVDQVLQQLPAFRP